LKAKPFFKGELKAQSKQKERDTDFGKKLDGACAISMGFIPNDLIHNTDMTGNCFVGATKRFW
jgi:hypothetical protein